MLKALVLLELRRLMPWILLFALLCLSTLFTDFFGKYSPDQTFWSISVLPLLQESLPRLAWHFGLVFGFVGLPREREDGTLAYLLSQPVPRRKIFLSKALANGLILTIGTLLTLCLATLYALANNTSFAEHDFRWDWAAQGTGLLLLVVWSSVSYGLLLSAFGHAGLVFLLLCFLAAGTSGALAEAMQGLSPKHLLEPQYSGSHWLWPWKKVGLHLGFGLIALRLAGYFWVEADQPLNERLAGIAKKPKYRFFAAIAVIVPVGVYWSLQENTPKLVATKAAAFGQSHLYNSPEAIVLTERFEFRFPEGFRFRLEPLSQQADAYHDRIEKLLGAPPGNARIWVDLKRRSRTNAGNAGHETIRMDFANAADERLLLEVLVHETTHVLADRASNGHLTQQGAAMTVFNEGLATWISYQLVDNAQQLERHHFEATLTHLRHKVRADQLFDDSSFSAQYGIAAKYTLGLTWVEALITQCGPQFPQQFLDSLGEDNLPLKASKKKLWQHLLQQSDCDIVAAQAQWELDLAQYETRWKDELEAVPDLIGGAATRLESHIMLRAGLEGTAPPAASVRIAVRRKHTGSLGDEYSFPGTLDENGQIQFEVPVEYVVDDLLRFQLHLHWRRNDVLTSHSSLWKRTRVPTE